MTDPPAAPAGLRVRLRAEADTHGRFYAALGTGALVWLVTWGQHAGLRVLLAADVFFAVFITLMLLQAGRLDAEALRARGARWRRRRRAGLGLVGWLTFCAMLLSLWSIFVLLNHPRAEGRLFPTLAVLSVPLSWAMTHTLAAFQYASLYYLPGPDGRPAGGLDFAGSDPPDAFDFLYQAFVVGASFSVSDVPASSRAMRRAVMVHSLAAFAYNTVLIAIAVNAALTLAGS
jgi:uncharacterized membrane protein